MIASVRANPAVRTAATRLSRSAARSVGISAAPSADASGIARTAMTSGVARSVTQAPQQFGVAAPDLAVDPVAERGYNGDNDD